MTAALNVGTVRAVAGRREPFDWYAFEKDGRTASVFVSGDKVRFKLSAITDGQPSGAPLLDVDTDSAAAGSHVTIQSLDPAEGQVILDGADTKALSGKYAFELNLVDASDSNKLKVICRGILDFVKSHAGAGVP